MFLKKRPKNSTSKVDLLSQELKRLEIELESKGIEIGEELSGLEERVVEGEKVLLEMVETLDSMGEARTALEIR